jgi:uncharacterized protein YdeI (YjbR/CyaY-like superfamily)
MEITQTLYVADRASWRAWLQEHHRSAPDIWLIYYRKAVGKARVSYNDAVEEALCFGWIDSTLKGLDVDRLAQRFSPRRPGSPYSQPNRERLRRLIAVGQVASDLLPRVEAVLRETFEAPADLLQVLREDPAGWAHFQECSPAYQRIRLAFVEAARARPEEFQKRLRHLVRMNAKNKQFGHGIETYF